ncbi:MAG: TolB family protein, partial [Cyclobacteriaceae bacterium]
MTSKRALLLSIGVLSILTSFAQNKQPFSRMDVFELEWVTDPQISPDGNLVVYVRRGMNIMTDRREGNLWIVNANGTGNEKLTPHDGSESSPAWSPDGSRIAYVSSTDEGAEIFVFWLKTGRLAKLTQLNRSPRGLVWSPDGKQIAFSMHVPGNELSLVKPPAKPDGAKWADAPRITTRLKHEADGSGYMEPGYAHLFVVPAEGGTARQVTSGNFQHRSSPVWSLDGKQLIFSSNRNDDWEYDFDNSELYSVNINDGKVNTLTTRKGPDHSPAVSPDGKSIAYLGFDDRTQTYQITRLYTMTLDGSGKKEIDTKLDRDVFSPTWDTDGKGLYFQYDDKGNTKIGYVNLAGKVTTLTNNLGGDDPSRPYGGGSFSMSSNGKFAFTHTTPEHPSELAVADKTGKVNLITNLNNVLLDYRQLGKVVEIWYKSTVDNLDVQGWFVKPPFFEEGKIY